MESSFLEAIRIKKKKGRKIIKSNQLPRIQLSNKNDIIRYSSLNNVLIKKNGTFIFRGQQSSINPLCSRLEKHHSPHHCVGKRDQVRCDLVGMHLVHQTDFAITSFEIKQMYGERTAPSCSKMHHSYYDVELDLRVSCSTIIWKGRKLGPRRGKEGRGSFFLFSLSL